MRTLTQLEFGCDRLFLARAAGALALRGHQPVEPGNIDFDAIVAQHVLRQIQGKAIGVV